MGTCFISLFSKGAIENNFISTVYYFKKLNKVSAMKKKDTSEDLFMEKGYFLCFWLLKFYGIGSIFIFTQRETKIEELKKES